PRKAEGGSARESPLPADSGHDWRTGRLGSCGCSYPTRRHGRVSRSSWWTPLTPARLARPAGIRNVETENQKEFCCRLCGHAGLADHIAARNIRARALGDAPNGLGPKVAAAMPATSSLASSE